MVVDILAAFRDVVARNTGVITWAFALWLAGYGLSSLVKFFSGPRS
jgi:hypothetical protein